MGGGGFYVNRQAATTDASLHMHIADRHLDPHPQYKLATDADADLAAHVAAADPHTGYRLESVAIAAADLATTMGRLFTVADVAAMAALTSLREGDAAYVRDLDRVYTYNGSAWRGLRPAALIIGGGHAGSQDSNPASTWTALSTSFTITDPGLPVDIIATFAGVAFDFTTINIHEGRLGISIDGGSSFTYSQIVTSVNGQGGSHYNRGAVACTHARTNVTPTGNIVIRAEYQATATSGQLTGDITYTITPTSA